MGSVEINRIELTSPNENFLGSQGADLDLGVDGFWVFVGADFGGLGVSVGCGSAGG